jgi:hypothetical protein
MMRSAVNVLAQMSTAVLVDRWTAGGSDGEPLKHGIDADKGY